MTARRTTDSRRARWNAAKRRTLRPGICPRCMVRPVAVKRLKSGREKRMAQCQACTDYLRAYAAARRRPRVTTSGPRVTTSGAG